MPRSKEDSYQKYLEKKHSGFETPTALIELVVQKAVKSRMLERKKIVEGEVNEVYDVTTKDKGNVIVRISRMGRASFETEEHVIRLATSVGVPAPKVLLIENTSVGGQDLTLCVEEKIEGEPLKDLLKTMKKDSLKEILGQSAKILSLIHGITVGKFGPLDSEDNYSTWSEFVYKYDTKRNKIVKAGSKVGLDSALIDRAFEILSGHKDLFNLKTPKLLHGDFSPKHILVKNGQITGIIDFEDAKGGDPVRDIAWLNFFYFNAFPIEWFTDGYTNKEVIKDDFDLKMKLYKLNLGLDLINYYSSEKNESGMRYAKSRLVAELSNF